MRVLTVVTSALLAAVSTIDITTFIVICFQFQNNRQYLLWVYSQKWKDRSQRPWTPREVSISISCCNMMPCIIVCDTDASASEGCSTSIFMTVEAVAYPGILFGGGFNKFSWGQRLLAVCWCGQDGRDANITSMINTYCCVYSVEILLMMDSCHVQNMKSTLSNKFEKLYIPLAFITRIVLCI